MLFWSMLSLLAHHLSYVRTNERQVSRLGTSTIRRRRQTISSLFAEYGPYYAMRAYRMTPQSLLTLYQLLRPYMGEKKRKGSSNFG